MISVVVPVKDQWAHTEQLLECLAPQRCRVLVLDNGSTDYTSRGVRSLQRGGSNYTSQSWSGRLRYSWRPGLSIYQLWNLGFDWARKGQGRKPWHVLVTNNDVILPATALDALSAPLLTLDDAWVSYPDYDAEWREERPHTSWRATRGVLSDGGMLGACFMLAGHKIPWRPLVTDLTYEWWYGDNHLAEEIEQHGGQQIRVEGLPVQHVNEATASHLPPGQLYGMKYRDRQRWLQRYERK